MQNIIILFWKYLVEAWLNLFWEFINGKLFAVCIGGDREYVDVRDKSSLCSVVYMPQSNGVSTETQLHPLKLNVQIRRKHILLCDPLR
jgi:hypothetical protein